MKNLKIEIKWAVVFTLISIIWMLFEKTVGLHDIYIQKQLIYTNLFAIPAIAVYIFALQEKKKNYFSGDINWSQGFVSGTILAFSISILSPVAQYISFLFFNFF